MVDQWSQARKERGRHYQPTTPEDVPPLSYHMQLLTIYADRILDEHACVHDVEPYEAGTLRITDTGERLLTIWSNPGITYRILDKDERFPVIR